MASAAMASTGKQRGYSLPNSYPVEINKDSDNVILCRDFFPTMCPNNLDDEWAALTVKFRPFFAKTAWTGSQVNAKHHCGKNTKENRDDWLKFVRKDVLGKDYKNTMALGWCNGLQELVRMGGDKREDGRVVDFSFDGRTPYTQDDALDILFGEKIISMINKKQYEEPIACLIKWGYYLTMEGCSSAWAGRATEGYITKMKWRVELGNTCATNKALGVHSWHRLGKKLATNSYQTALRRKEERIWGVRLMGMSRLKKGEDLGKGEFTVDLSGYLPSRVRRDMKRVDAAVFRVKRMGNLEEDDDVHSQLSEKVSELVRWASVRGIAGKVEDAVSECVMNLDEGKGEGTTENPALATIETGNVDVGDQMNGEADNAIAVISKSTRKKTPGTTMAPAFRKETMEKESRKNHEDKIKNYVSKKVRMRVM